MTNTADPKAKTNKIYIGPASVRTACGGSEDKSATTRFAIRRGDQLATAVGCPRNKSRIRLREDLRSYWPIIRCRRPIFNKTVAAGRPRPTALYGTEVGLGTNAVGTTNFATAAQGQICSRYVVHVSIIVVRNLRIVLYTFFGSG